jgi:peptidoglycan/xylan/chitin deacetylase (PgdA/CDA1 family)
MDARAPRHLYVAQASRISQRGGKIMNPAHHDRQQPISDAEFSAPFTLPQARRLVEPSYRTVARKLSRVLARSVAGKPLPMRNATPLVSFTFDDAAASACNVGAALLERHQARGTYYISGGKCGAPSPTGRLATADQIKALYARGHEIGCHTFSHTPVAAISRPALAAEVDHNRAFLQGHLGNIVLRNFAYPYGDISFGAKRFLGGRFDSCRSLTPGVNAGVADLAVLKSNALEIASIDRAGIADLIAATVRLNGWLLFASHDVTNRPSRYGVTPDLVDFALRRAREAGCRVVSVGQALELVRGA